MKRLSVAVLALSVAALGVPVVTGGGSQQANQNDTKPQLMDINAKLINTKG
jgi:hypothetical protein